VLWKGTVLEKVQVVPARVAPAGSDRSRREGNDLSEAFDGKGRLVTARVCGL
jgi:hypothetical protein